MKRIVLSIILGMLCFCIVMYFLFFESNNNPISIYIWLWGSIVALTGIVIYLVIKVHTLTIRIEQLDKDLRTIIKQNIGSEQSTSKEIAKKSEDTKATKKEQASENNSATEELKNKIKALEKRITDWEEKRFDNRDTISNNPLLENQITQILDEIMPIANETIKSTINECLKEINSEGNLLAGKITEESDKDEDISNMKYLKTIQDGVFHSISNDPYDCFFRLFNEKGKMANFDFCGDEQVAIANKDSIKEVCDTSGSSIDATGIQNIINGAGTVELQDNGTWKVTQKTKIKFIS